MDAGLNRREFARDGDVDAAGPEHAERAERRKQCRRKQDNAVSKSRT